MLDAASAIRDDVKPPSKTNHLGEDAGEAKKKLERRAVARMPASSAPVGAAEAVLSPERSPNMPPEAAAMRERGGCRGEMPKCKLGRKGIGRS